MKFRELNKTRSQLRNASSITKYSEQIKDLQSQARKYAHLHEAESQKNKTLQFIIEDLEDKLMKVKKAKKKASSQQDQQLNLLQSIKVKNKLEYDLQQIIQKHNESLAQINLLKEQVNIARSERVIYSGIFKNLQKQIMNHSQQFKGLIIEKAKVQDQLRKSQTLAQNIKVPEDFTLNQAKPPSEEIINIKRSNKSLGEKMAFRKMQVPDEQKVSHNKRGSASVMDIEIEDLKTTFKKIKSAAGIQIQEIIQIYPSIQSVNNQSYEQSNRLADQIDRLQALNTSLAIDISKKENRLATNLKHQTPDLRPNSQEKIRQLQDKVQRERQMISQFKNKFLELGTLVQVVPPFASSQINLQQLGNYITRIQSKINNLLYFQSGHFYDLDQDFGKGEGDAEKERLDKAFLDIQDGQKSKVDDRVITKSEFQIQIKKMLEERRQRNVVPLNKKKRI